MNTMIEEPKMIARFWAICELDEDGRLAIWVRPKAYEQLPFPETAIDLKQATISIGFVRDRFLKWKRLKWRLDEK